jgi:hypothetical protein
MEISILRLCVIITKATIIINGNITGQIEGNVLVTNHQERNYRTNRTEHHIHSIERGFIKCNQFLYDML